MISWQRWLFLACLGLVEATPVAMVLALGGTNLWLPLIGLVFAGALADWLVQRFLRVERHRPVLLVLALLSSVLLVKNFVGAGYNPFDGWDAALSRVSNDGTTAIAAYITFFCGLYAFWRGTQLNEQDRFTIPQYFTRIVVGMIVFLGVGALISYLDQRDIQLISFQLLVFFALGMFTIALANAADGQHNGFQRFDWRSLLTLAASIAIVVVVGLLFSSIFGDTAANLVIAVWRVVAGIATLIMSPLLLLLSGLVTWLFSFINAEGFASFIRQLEEQQRQRQQQAESLAQTASVPPWVIVAVQLFCLVVPFLLAVALFLLVRRTKRPSAHNEERQSLLHWQTISSDIRDLFGSLLKRPSPTGLRAALAGLRGTDPASRIRRAYIRLLLAAENREKVRAAWQTPREFGPAAAEAVARAQKPVTTLTAAYERARYHPNGVTPNDADQAEQAWREIDPDKPAS